MPSWVLANSPKPGRSDVSAPMCSGAGAGAGSSAAEQAQRQREGLFLEGWVLKWQELEAQEQGLPRWAAHLVCGCPSFRPTAGRRRPPSAGRRGRGRPEMTTPEMTTRLDCDPLPVHSCGTFGAPHFSPGGWGGAAQAAIFPKPVGGWVAGPLLWCMVARTTAFDTVLHYTAMGRNPSVYLNYKYYINILEDAYRAACFISPDL